MTKNQIYTWSDIRPNIKIYIRPHTGSTTISDIRPEIELVERNESGRILNIRPSVRQIYSLPDIELNIRPHTGYPTRSYSPPEHIPSPSLFTAGGDKSSCTGGLAFQGVPPRLPSAARVSAWNRTTLIPVPD